VAVKLWSSNAATPLLMEGLEFREWLPQDAARMSYLFDTDPMNRWTPLPTPFTVSEALGYVERAHELRRRLGSLQLAVCEIGGQVVGELLLFPGRNADDLEMAYGIGADYQGQGYASASVRAGLTLARNGGISTTTLMIAVDNPASMAVAERTGFMRTEVPLEERRRKGFVLQMAMWEQKLVRPA